MHSSSPSVSVEYLSIGNVSRSDKTPSRIRVQKSKNTIMLIRDLCFRHKSSDLYDTKLDAVRANVSGSNNAHEEYLKVSPMSSLIVFKTTA